MRYPLFSLFALLACEPDKNEEAAPLNAPPQAAISSHATGSEVLEGVVVRFEGWVSDPDSSPEDLKAKWQVGGETVCDFAPGTFDGYTSCDRLMGIEDTRIKLTVIDPEGATGEDEISVEVSPSASPEALIIQPSPNGAYASNQQIIFEGILSDEEDPASDLSATWTSSLDGVLSDVNAVPDVDGHVISYGMLSEGQHLIELRVEDSTGKTGTDSVDIAVGSARLR